MQAKMAQDWHDPAMPYGALTALAFAARRGHIEAAGALLDAGANVNDAAVVMDGEPPTPVLTLAVANAHYELAGYLLDRGPTRIWRRTGGRRSISWPGRGRSRPKGAPMWAGSKARP